ncbi:transglutaminase-like domain-containing protein, partial [Actinophytocola sp.]|uniref:transglutaminase-like domain-containing protein n=1 Tax=Actinophytocola sp. TaxID=1872138 RepID=UPI003D6A8EB3
DLVLATVAPAAVAAAWALWVRLWVRRPRANDGHVPAWAVLVGVLAVVAATAVVTHPGAAVLSGPYRLLTGALPLDPGGPELAAVAAVTGFAALVGCYLALSRRSALAPALPALVCLLAGLGLAASVGDPPAWYAPAFVALAGLLLLAGRAGAGQGARGIRSRLVAAGVLVVGMVAPAAVATVAPGMGAREPADLRSLVAAPVRPKASVNPFAQYLALRNGELNVDITASASAEIGELRMVTLTEFDGRRWSVGGDYRRAGHRLPPAKLPTGGASTVTANIGVSPRGALGWLPTAGRATEIDVAGLGVEEATGDVVVPAGTSAPASYRVTGAEPVFEPADLLGDGPAPAATPPAVELTPEIRGFITRTAPEGIPYARLRALRDALKSAPFGEDRLDDAAGGHSLYRINALLDDHRGTSEQYASALAVMCRGLGWDARVVLGFRFDRARTVKVTGRDVHAWVEVRFARHGWVPVDPTPEQASSDRDDGHRAPPRHDDPLASAPAPDQPPPRPGDHAGPAASTSDSPAGPPAWVVATVAVLAGLVVLALTVPVAKTVRRARRRRAGTTRARVIAAWREALDAIGDAGRRLSRAATTGEVLAAHGSMAPAAMRTLARSTDFAAFAPDGPTDDDAIAAWANSDDIRRSARDRLRRSARIRAALDPRSLFANR